MFSEKNGTLHSTSLTLRSSHDHAYDVIPSIFVGLDLGDRIKSFETSILSPVRILVISDFMSKKQFLESLVFSKFGKNVFSMNKQLCHGYVKFVYFTCLDRV